MGRGRSKSLRYAPNRPPPHLRVRFFPKMKIFKGVIFLKKFKCLACKHEFEVSRQKARFMDGSNCPKCKGPIVPILAGKKVTLAIFDELHEK